MLRLGTLFVHCVVSVCDKFLQFDTYNLILQNWCDSIGIVSHVLHIILYGSL